MLAGTCTTASGTTAPSMSPRPSATAPPSVAYAWAIRVANSAGSALGHGGEASGSRKCGTWSSLPTSPWCWCVTVRRSGAAPAVTRRPPMSPSRSTDATKPARSRPGSPARRSRSCSRARVNERARRAHSPVSPTAPRSPTISASGTTASTRAARCRRSAPRTPTGRSSRTERREGRPPREVAERADRVIARACAAGGPVALFSHGHFLRVLGARWVGLPASGGVLLGLDTATLSFLGHEHDQRVLRVWNS